MVLMAYIAFRVKTLIFYAFFITILQIINYSKIEMKSKLENQKSNITLRNFPDTVENIRKKWQIKDGGTLYSFFTTDLQNNKIVLLCKKN
jgi:hypothetical protein